MKKETEKYLAWVGWMGVGMFLTAGGWKILLEGTHPPWLVVFGMVSAVLGYLIIDTNGWLRK